MFGQAFPTGRVGTHYFDSNPPPPLPFVQTTKRPISAGVQASAKHDDLHSQPASVNNVPNNYVTVFGLLHENVTPPHPSSPAGLLYANGGNSALRTGSDGAPGRSQAT